MYKVVTKHFRSNTRNEILGVATRNEALVLMYDVLELYEVYDFKRVHEMYWDAAIDGVLIISVEVVESDETLT